MFSFFKNVFESPESMIFPETSAEGDRTSDFNEDPKKIMENEFKKFEAYLADFFKESTNVEFNDTLLKELKMLAEDISQERTKKVASDALEELDQMLGALNHVNQDSPTLEKSNVSLENTLKEKVEDFFNDFVKRNFKSLLKITDDKNFWSNVSDGGKYCVGEKDVGLSSKGIKKVENAVKSFAYTSSHDQEYPSVPHDFIALFDTTTFGSATDGILFTHDSVYCKSLGGDRTRFRLETIYRIRVDGDVLKINSTDFQFFHSEIKNRLKLVVEAINEYINQPGYLLKRYIKNKKPPYVST
ncbi:hypothetical protein [Undibacterium sp. Ji49W]|uniref:hypothetical protein n=1 Tax=Undibacterium sp. Ji49W TaxID=3413040 RepID=UPI003BF321E1